ncbi:MAG: Hsp20/alpha crystallin family protein [Candidatus Omnitrophica bacterium]|nr:Hsp20/alpha crystallin family protein [Candidatus Omnitrophota bacterium]MCK5177914.1 Hsp20/alpha crystallin family protein [Candidatus Omnitrophota bacterium]
MKLTHWKPKAVDPFGEFFNFDSIQSEFSLLPGFDRGFGFGKNSVFPAVDVSAEENQVIVKVDIPGLKREDISLSAEGSVLTVLGERNLEEEKKNKRFHRCERSYGRFERSIDIGTNIDQSKVRAKYRDGVLNITILKTNGSQKRQIQIEG